MRILITGVCGFVGSTLAKTWVEGGAGHALYGVDTLIRSGSELNRQALRRLGVTVLHRDIRSAADFEGLPPVDWVVDAAANPSVLAGVDGRTSSRQLVEHNLFGTVNLLEYCRTHRAGFILLSTSRVYSIAPLSELRVKVVNGAFRLMPDQHVRGLSECGVAEGFSTDPPVSLYGTTKRASEQLALEYGATFDFPVWINRCGVLAGGAQFGRPDQGIFSYWVHGWAARRRLAYIGFDGLGHQVRDCLHPRDLVSLLEAQATTTDTRRPRTVNVSGGSESACSLRGISEWCTARFGPHEVFTEPGSRPFDLPWMVLDNRLARESWDWAPLTSREEIFEEIARHAEEHPEWLEITHD
jgi:CDP-paratose 2-epimerase